MTNPCIGCRLDESCENENTDKRHECRAFQEYEKHQSALFQNVKIVLKGDIFDYEEDCLESFEEDGLDGIVIIGIDEGEKITSANVFIRGIVEDEFSCELRKLVNKHYPRRT